MGNPEWSCSGKALLEAVHIVVPIVVHIVVPGALLP